MLQFETPPSVSELYRHTLILYIYAVFEGGSNWRNVVKYERKRAACVFDNNELHEIYIWPFRVNNCLTQTELWNC